MKTFQLLVSLFVLSYSITSDIRKVENGNTVLEPEGKMVYYFLKDNQYNTKYGCGYVPDNFLKTKPLEPLIRISYFVKPNKNPLDYVEICSKNLDLFLRVYAIDDMYTRILKKKKIETIYLENEDGIRNTSLLIPFTKLNFTNLIINGSKVENVEIQFGFLYHKPRAIFSYISLQLLIVLELTMYVILCKEFGNFNTKGKGTSLRLYLFHMLYLSLRIIYFIGHSITSQNDMVDLESKFLILYHFSSGIYYASFQYYFLRSIRFHTKWNLILPIFVISSQLFLAFYHISTLKNSDNLSEILQVIFLII